MREKASTYFVEWARVYIVRVKTIRIGNNNQKKTVKYGALISD